MQAVDSKCSAFSPCVHVVCKYWQQMFCILIPCLCCVYWWALSRAFFLIYVMSHCFTISFCVPSIFLLLTLPSCIEYYKKKSVTCYSFSYFLMSLYNFKKNCMAIFHLLLFHYHFFLIYFAYLLLFFSYISLFFFLIYFIFSQFLYLISLKIS